MKRSGFQRKLTTPLKRSGFSRKVSTTKKKPVKLKISRLKARLWELCKQITRLRYGGTCFTCGRTGLTGSNQQTGHFIANSVGGASLRYNLDNLRIQCYFCNVNAGGNGAVYYKNLVAEKGQEFVDNLFILKQQIIKADELWYIQKIYEYDGIYSELLHEEL